MGFSTKGIRPVIPIPTSSSSSSSIETEDWNIGDESSFLKDRLWSEQDAQIEAHAQEQMSDFTCNGLQVLYS
jgi:hypothetical protein